MHGMSQLLARLDQELKTASTNIQRAEILARKGSYLARVGRFSETREIIAKLRSHFGDGRSGHVTAWIMLTEGLLHLFENLSPLALDRVARAQLLGLAMKDASVIAIASAWKAHIEFEQSDFESMINSVKVAIAHVTDDDHDANARLAMVISDSFLLCGETQVAQSWFMRSREHALKDGDQASIEALLYNRAAFSLARIRVERCFSDIDSDRLSLLRMEIASAKNLQTLTGIAALTNFIHLCEARLLILEEKYSLAIDALTNIRNAQPFADYNFNQSFVNLEVSFCLQRLGRHAEARSVFESIDWTAFERLDVDEQLVAAWMRRLICAEDSSMGAESVAKELFDHLSKKYEQMRSLLSASLQPFAGIN
jgi:tetratricopeptide (TPR) repeat protein